MRADPLDPDDDTDAEVLRRLEGLTTPSIGVPSEVDEIILADAARALARPRRRWIPVVAAAALLVAVAGMLSVRASRAPDVVDAYALALVGRETEAQELLRRVVVLVAVPVDGERFAAYDVLVDAGEERLAAWQVEVTCGGKLVGVEGGEGCWAEPAAYDPAALEGGRIVLAAFTRDARPPSGRVRVARIHVLERVGGATARLVAAAARRGWRIEAKVEVMR